jgi:hypothetical protein
MNEAEIEARLTKLLKDEADDPEGHGWWWLSYADDEGFNGAVLIRANGFMSACQFSANVGFSPGGQVRGTLTPKLLEEVCPDVIKAYANRVLTKEECAEFDVKIDEAARARGLVPVEPN